MWPSLSCCVMSGGPTSWPDTSQMQEFTLGGPRAGTGSPTATLHDFTSSTRISTRTKLPRETLTLHCTYYSLQSLINLTVTSISWWSDLATLLYIKLKRTKSKQRVENKGVIVNICAIHGTHYSRGYNPWQKLLMDLSHIKHTNVT